MFSKRKDLNKSLNTAFHADFESDIYFAQKLDQSAKTWEFSFLKSRFSSYSSRNVFKESLKTSFDGEFHCLQHNQFCLWVLRLNWVRVSPANHDHNFDLP